MAQRFGRASRATKSDPNLLIQGNFIDDDPLPCATQHEKPLQTAVIFDYMRTYTYNEFSNMPKDLAKEQMQELFEEVSNYFFLLSEPTRLKILHALCNGERPVGEIVTEIESTQANVSRQLNMLYRAKILARRKDGTQVYYRIDDQNTVDLCRTVCGQMSDKIVGRHSLDKDAVDSFMAGGE